MIHMNEALIVEGRYDKSKLSALTDAIIVTTNGFGIYKDAEKRDFIRKLAKERGIVILTDSDNAGRQIRAYITSFVPSNQIRHAYIPDVYGKEKRKAAPSKEGKLGVEGISSEILLEILKEAGASVEGSTADFQPLTPGRPHVSRSHRRRKQRHTASRCFESTCSPRKPHDQNAPALGDERRKKGAAFSRRRKNQKRCLTNRKAPTIISTMAVKERSTRFHRHREPAGGVSRCEKTPKYIPELSF